MIERGVEMRMRTWYRDRVQAVTVPDELRARVVAIPNELPAAGPAPFRGRRTALLLAAALLVTLVAGTAIAIGAGLLRLPWLPEPPDPVVELSGGMLGPLPCDEALPEPLVLSVNSWPADGRDRTVLVYEDGTVLVREKDHDRSRETVSRRQVTAAAAEELRLVAEESGLDGCIEIPVDGRALTVTARTTAGIATAQLGRGSGLRIPTQDELDAGAALAARLNDADLGLPASAWTVYDAQAYEPEGWEIRLGRTAPEATDDEFVVHHVQWQSLVLPDGSTFMTVGSPVSYDEGYEELRCVVVGPEAANEWEAFLGEPMQPGGQAWAYQDRDGRVIVRLSRLLPHESACGPMDDEPVMHPQTDDMLRDVRVCEYLDEDLFGHASEDVEHRPAWAACEYLSFGWVFESRYPLTTGQAENVLTSQFGTGGFTTERIRGTTVYWSRCSEDAACQQAFAVFDEPYLVIVAPDNHWNHFRPIVDRVIDSMERMSAGGS